MTLFGAGSKSASGTLRSRVMTKDTGIAPSGRAGRAIFSPVCSSVAPAVAGSQKLVVSTTVVPLPENKGTCDNLLTVRRGELETKVLDCFVPTTEVNV